jgi:hypothetical protein
LSELFLFFPRQLREEHLEGCIWFHLDRGVKNVSGSTQERQVAAISKFSGQKISLRANLVAEQMRANIQAELRAYADLSTRYVDCLKSWPGYGRRVTQHASTLD